MKVKPVSERHGSGLVPSLQILKLGTDVFGTFNEAYCGGLSPGLAGWWEDFAPCSWFWYVRRKEIQVIT